MKNQLWKVLAFTFKPFNPESESISNAQIRICLFVNGSLTLPNNFHAFRKFFTKLCKTASQNSSMITTILN